MKLVKQERLYSPNSLSIRFKETPDITIHLSASKKIGDRMHTLLKGLLDGSFSIDSKGQVWIGDIHPRSSSVEEFLKLKEG